MRRVSPSSKVKRIEDHDLHPESLMMSYGYKPELSEGAIKPPIFQSSTFVFESAAAGKAFFQLAYGLRDQTPGEEIGLIYSRLNNPNLEILEDRLTLWDDAEACAVFESGMAAITTTLLELLQPGDVLLYSQPIYGGTDHFIRHVLPRFGIVPVGFRAGLGREEMEEALARARAAGATGPLSLVYVETPANPTNQLVDIALCADVAREHSTGDRRALVAVDNTFLGPLFQHPLKHGADLVLYSATKYIGGHSDVIAGACLGGAELLKRVRVMRTFLGTMAGPWTAWLLLRSLETLKMRMTAGMKNARYVADFLAEHPQVERVHYLGHLDETDPQFALYRRQCLAPGAMISFDVVGGEDAAFRFLDALRLIKLAVSLGGTESLAEHPATMTHADIPPEAQREMGIGAGMIRLSVGVEHPEDLIADLRQALEA
jgi:methionine-gamma-lyase